MANELAQSNNSAQPFSSLLAEHSSEDLKQALVVSDNKIAPPDQAATAAHPIVPYKSNTYMAEKRQGLRRPNGARKLKKLSNRHLRIITMHLQGKSGEFISSTMGVTFITVSRVLNDPLAVDLIASVYKDRQNEIDALAGDAIDAVRIGLNSDSDRIRLSAVGSFAKLKDTIGKEETSAKTAEDVVSEIFARADIDTVNMQVNIGKSNGK